MRIAFGTDDRTETTNAIESWLHDAGHEVSLVAERGAAWPDVGFAVGRAMAEGHAEMGVVCCWTGTGVSIAANKVPAVRAALCVDATTAVGARRWNDANVLALSLRLTTPAVAAEVLEAFLSAEPDVQARDDIDLVG